MTIDLGFAWLKLPGIRGQPGRRAGPRAFIKNMLAGVGAVTTPACSSWPPPRAGSRSPRSTCASCNSSASPTVWWPSPRSGLGRRRSGASWPTSKLEDHLTGTFLEAGRGHRRRAPAGVGAVDDLRAALDRLLLARHPARRRPRPTRPVGRPLVRGAKGSGTVITGTLVGGPPRRRRRARWSPALHEVRVRRPAVLHRFAARAPRSTGPPPRPST